MMPSDDTPEVRHSTGMPEARPSPMEWQPRFGRLALLGTLFLSLLVLAPAVYFGLGSPATVLLIALLLAAGALILLRGSYDLQVASSLALLAAAGTAASFGGGAPSSGTFFFLAAVTLATLLWSPEAGVVATILSLLVAAVGAVVASMVSGPPAQSPAGWIGVALAVLLFGLAIVFGVRSLRREHTDALNAPLGAAPSLEAREAPREESRASTAEAWARALEIGRIANGIRDPAEMATRLPRLVAEGLSCRLVKLYLVDAQGDQAVLSGVFGNSVGPELDSGEAVALSSTGAIADAIRSRHICSVPEREGELAVPMTVEERVLGALVLLPNESVASVFDQLDAIQALGSQLAVALDTARAFQEARHRAGERGTPPRETLPASWNPFAESPRQEYELGAPEVVGEAEMRVPLSLRDETIGTISLAADTDWSEEQRNLVEAVATQAALALENAQLVEASQLTARREHMLAEITGKVWASPTIEGILRTAVQELGQALDAEQASIELKMERSHGN